MRFLTSLAIASIASLPQNVRSTDWNYEQNGSDWTGTCATGTRQSPIDIGTTNLDPTENILFKYGTITTFDMENDGHSLKISPKDDPGFSVRVTGPNESKKDFKLQQLHFHRQAEHLMNGSKRYEMEIHLVHASTEANDESLVVVGITIDDSSIDTVPGTQRFLDSIIDYGPPASTESSKAANCTSDTSKCLDLVAAIGYTSPKNSYGNFYRYDGSLTTPPCNEIVTWFVAAEPLRADLSSFIFLPQVGLDPNNYRLPQSNNATIIVAHGTKYADDRSSGHSLRPWSLLLISTVATVFFPLMFH